MGEGGMGTVYRVHDRELRRDVALKVMRQAGPSALHALKREFRSRAGLSHPNLVQLHDLIVGDDFCCFSMELIEGRNFLGWVRPERSRELAPLPPEAAPRLRAVLAQLVRGLQALHASGLVHRDIKPSNVLVSPEGRVVIVDFGLATELQVGPLARGGSSAAGTLPYMAPEQLQGGPLTPASDLYAVGLMLYEALTGLRAFRDETAYFLTGDTELLLQRRRSVPSPDPRRIAPGIPDDLAELAMALLSVLPGERPDATALLARLPVAELPTDARPWDGNLLFGPPKPSFVGRATELAVLDEALRGVTRKGQQLTVHVHGPSGIGKSTLMREFLRRQGELLILKGRCHPREVVPYLSLDPIIDALASHLSTLRDEALALVPEQAHALVRLFPVLGRVSALRDAPVPATLPADVELRRLGAEALRELLRRLARRGPLVVWIDDVQWGDADSARLLEQLLREPAPPAFLLLLTGRGGDDCLPCPAGGLNTPAARVRELPLGPLSDGEAKLLARQWLAGTPVKPEALRSLAGQAEGSPFVVGEVARYLAAVAGRGTAPDFTEPLDLQRVLAERLRALPALQRALVELAAVAGVPLPRDVLLAGAGLDPGGRPLLSELCDASLLRLACGERAEAMTTYHDRTREAALAQLGDAARAWRHRELAEALEHAGSDDLELLVAQWQGAGEPTRAGGYAVRAADRAAHALAFDHAARLYEQALTLLGDTADRPALLERLGDVLSHLGRRVDAAARYLEAAEALGAGEAEQVHTLRRRAAEQSIKCGRVEEG
jgi:serine/threonine protein kinase/tetratricopeptide (TPR) repeat protein